MFKYFELSLALNKCGTVWGIEHTNSHSNLEKKNVYLQKQLLQFHGICLDLILIDVEGEVRVFEILSKRWERSDFSHQKGGLKCVDP